MTVAAGCGGDASSELPYTDDSTDASSDPSSDGSKDASTDTKPDGAAGSKSDADAAEPADGPEGPDSDAGCSAGFKLCSGKCVAADDPKTGCAAASCEPCDVPHAVASCSNTGACSIGACDEGFGDCDKNAANGCEGNLQSDPANCATCGNVCPAGTGAAVCESGVCGVSSCKNGKGDCDKDPSNGCEVELATSAEHCGFCGNVCDLPHAAEKCVASACAIDVCNQGHGDCNADPADGCEVDLQKDPANCSSCGSACAAPPNSTAACSVGTCGYECKGGWQDCDGDPSNGCERNLASDPAHCGACGTVCTAPNGTPACSGGTCAIAACNPGFLDCDGQAATGCEVDGMTSEAHCGQCQHACLLEHAASECLGGACVFTCAAPWADCDSALVDGCNVNTLVSLDHCGGCGSKCDPPNASELCDNGACKIASCSGSYADCNGLVGDGCEADVASDPAHCGSCSTACSFVNAAPLCVGGTCAMGACLGSFRDCDALASTGCETDVMVSLANCGGCGKPCAFDHAAESCVGGTCAMGACDGAWADCDSAQANGCEASLSNDKKNCGACGHDCLGGTCNNGKCSPIVIATGQNKPWGIAVDGAHVYWTNRLAATGSVRRAPIGGGAVEILASNQDDPDGIAVNSTHVFWANVNADTVTRLSKSGGFLEIVGTGDGACGVSVTDSVLAWTNWLADSVKAGSPDGTSSWIVSGSQNIDPHRIVTDGVYVWWTNWTGYNSNGTVRRAKLDGTGVVTIAAGQSQPIGVAVDGTYVYWTNEGNGRVMRAEAFGPVVVTTMATGQTAATGLVVDSTHLYFNSPTQGAIRRMLKTNPSGPVETLATGQGNPVYLAADAVSIYWTNHSTGTVMRLAK